MPGPAAAAIAPPAPDTPAPAAAETPQAPTQQMAPDVKSWWTQRQQQLAEEDQARNAEIAELQKYKDTVLRMASNPNYGNYVLDFMEGKPAPTTGPALRPQAAPAQGIPGADEEPIEPELKNYVEGTIVNAVQTLKAEIANAMTPHIRRLERLNADSMLNAAKTKYPDIDKFAPQIKEKIAAHPTLNPEEAYHLVAIKEITQRNEQQGFERGVQQGRFDAFDPMAVGRGETPQETGTPTDVQAKIDRLMDSGDTYNAVLTALQDAKRQHMGAPVG